MTILVSGFEPFGGEAINPSWEAVKLLPDTVGSIHIVKIQIPVIYGEAALAVIEKAEEIEADAIICVGQAGGRSAVTPEKVGINWRSAIIADNAGILAQDEPVIPHGPDAYFSTLPVLEMTKAITDAGVPAQLSLSAGSYVCNDVLYTLLHHFNGSATRVCFIHIPYLPQQAKENVPSLSLEQDIVALNAAINHLEK